ncbi:heat shock protein Hsp20 [Sulfuritortus calidifontis]|uniref:Heat shock protein Hsp20 n=1 Tax=Sulfuritortus calidifontis TaxID=1914471 RepID=A0A4R3JT66_9PROT|nr:Hsp20/alpha crystallin family protein [Sulfuritortus calidifontis]TCS70540.1 heat shock protein Hsp20 [Sulfuritortus calidifontis]
MKLEQVKESVQSFWDNVAEGWRHLWHSASGALTRFKPGDKTDLPGPVEVDDVSWLPSRGWSMLGGDVFEDDKRLVVRLEVPGLEKEDIDIQVTDDALIVSGEKRFQKEDTQGRWRVMQCAYGSFRRVVPLPLPVKAEAARASYRNGVLKVELPKQVESRPRAISVKID